MSTGGAHEARRALARALHPDRRDVSPLVEIDARAWLDEADWGGVTPLLAERFSQAGALDRLPPDAVARLRKAALDAQLASSRLDQAFQCVQAVFARIGLDHVALKGMALARLVYDRPALRPMSDIDLLVEPGRVDEALDTLAAEGFRLPSKRTLDLARSASKCVPVRPPLDFELEIEIHWSIVQEGRNHVSIPRLFRDAQPLEIAGRPSRALGHTDLLLHQTLHHSYHAFEPKLIWLVDLASLHRDAPEPTTVLDEARAWGMETALALSIRHLEKVFPGNCRDEFVRFAHAHRRAGTILRLLGDADPLCLLRGWKSAKTQLLLKAATLDSAGALRWQLATWGRRFLRFGGRPGESSTWDEDTA